MLIDTAKAGWEPTQGSDALELASRLQNHRIKALVATLVPELGGVWTDFVDDVEVVRFGYPKAPAPRAFDPFDPAPGLENLFVTHWGRITYGREVRLILTFSPQCAGALRLGIAGQEVAWWGVAQNEKTWADAMKQGVFKPKRYGFRGPFFPIPACMITLFNKDFGKPSNLFPATIPQIQATQETLPDVIFKQLNQGS